MEIFSWKTILSVLSHFVGVSLYREVNRKSEKLFPPFVKKGRKTWKCALMIVSSSVYMKYMTNLGGILN